MSPRDYGAVHLFNIKMPLMHCFHLAFLQTNATTVYRRKYGNKILENSGLVGPWIFENVFFENLNFQCIHYKVHGIFAPFTDSESFDTEMLYKK